MKAIPAQQQDAWADDDKGQSQAPAAIGLNLLVAVNNSIKMLVRPEKLKNPLLMWPARTPG